MEVISQELIELDINIETKDRVIEYAAKKMTEFKRINDKEKLIEDIYLREEEASTSMGLGVAIPHAQSSAVLEASVVFIRLKNEINWNDDKDVRLVFGIFVPSENVDNTHLKILAQIARKLASEDFRNQLLTIQTVEECAKLLESINNQLNEEQTA